MSWLWPESDLKGARWSLNSAVYALRKLLGGCLPSLSASETVLLEKGRYRLSPRIEMSADTEEFDLRYAAGRRLEEAGRVPEAVAEYEKAVGVYRGDYLIEDLYEDWTAIERERLVDSYTDLLRRLALHHMKSGQPRESVRTCYRILEKDRCDEDTHRLLMECFVRLGQRARALRQWVVRASTEARARHGALTGDPDPVREHPKGPWSSLKARLPKNHLDSSATHPRFVKKTSRTARGPHGW